MSDYSLSYAIRQAIELITTPIMYGLLDGRVTPVIITPVLIPKLRMPRSKG